MFVTTKARRHEGTKDSRRLRAFVPLCLHVGKTIGAALVLANSCVAGPVAAQEFTKGKFLVAAPDMQDPRFARTVIFMVDHNSNGAFGLVVNRVVGRRPMGDFTDVEPGAEPREVDLHWGGPVAEDRGTALHSPEYRRPGTIVVDGKVAMTGDPELLKDIAAGRGPKHFMILFGYSGWAPGQLEGELERGGWIVVPAEAVLVFDSDHHTKWQRAYKLRTTDL